MTFPASQYKDTVTIFTPCIHPDTGEKRFCRRVLQKTFWHEDSLTVNRAGGTAAPKQVNLNVPLKYNHGYITAADWLHTPPEALEGFWAVLLGGDALFHSVIVRGDILCPEITAWQDSDTLGGLYKGFKAEYEGQIHQPANLDEVLYGPPGMHRIIIAC